MRTSSSVELRVIGQCCCLIELPVCVSGLTSSPHGRCVVCCWSSPAGVHWLRLSPLRHSGWWSHCCRSLTAGSGTQPVEYCSSKRQAIRSCAVTACCQCSVQNFAAILILAVLLVMQQWNGGSCMGLPAVAATVQHCSTAHAADHHKLKTVADLHYLHLIQAGVHQVFCSAHCFKACMSLLASASDIMWGAAGCSKTMGLATRHHQAAHKAVYSGCCSTHSRASQQLQQTTLLQLSPPQQQMQPLHAPRVS